MIMTSYILDSITKSPRDWIVCGSNDGLEFHSLDKQCGFIFPSATSATSTTFYRILAECTKSYAYYRIVVTKTTPLVDGTATSIKNFYLNGLS
jgi:hypothetical protein